MTAGAPRPARATALSLGSGALATALSALALARWSHVDRPGFLLGWIAFVPWLWLLDRVTSWRMALLAGWAMSVAFVLAVFGWFALAIHGYTGAPPWLGYALLAVTAPLLEPQFLVAAAARQAARMATPAAPWLLRALCTAAAYVGAEWALPKLLGDTVGYGFWQSAWLRQGADAIGAHGLTFVLLLVNECALAAVVTLRRAERRLPRVIAPLALAAGLLLALALYGAARLAQHATRPSSATITVAAIQAGLGDYRTLAAERGTYGAVRSVLDTSFALTERALRERPALVVWPETVYPTTFGAPKSEDGAAFDRELAGFVAERHVPLVFGAYDADADREYNAAIVLERDAAGRVGFDAYRKARLFPLTEQVPAVLDHASVRRWLPWLGTWRPGTGPSVLDVGDGSARIRIAPLICYDAVAPELARRAVNAGAELLVTLSNDAWFASGDGPLQHFVVAGFRSIETRTPQVRATTTGISAIVTATGETLARADVGTRAALVAPVQRGMHQRTLLLLWGDWLPPAAVLAALALLLASPRTWRAAELGPLRDPNGRKSLPGCGGR